MQENTKAVSEEATIDLTEILQIVRKRLLIICCIVIAALGLTTVYTFFIQKPTYQSSGTMIVAYEGLSNEASSTQYNFAKLISDTYVVFIKDIVMDDVAKETELSKSYLQNHLTITNESLLLKITYQAENPEFSQVVVDLIMEKAQEIADSVDENGNPKYKMLNDNLKVISDAKPGTKVSSVSKNLMIGALVGVVLAGVVVFLLEFFDRTFRSHEEIERTLGIPVLANIPYYDWKDENDGKTGKGESGNDK